MGCFSYLCKISGKPAYSTCFEGSPVHIFLLQDGKVIEHMYGNYDSYGRVLDGKGESFKWNLDWNMACRLHFSSNPGNGFAVILAKHYKEGDAFPTTRSNDDPNQGAGFRESTKFKKVAEPFHKVY